VLGIELTHIRNGGRANAGDRRSSSPGVIGFFAELLFG
jgi:hypothetical protein